MITRGDFCFSGNGQSSLCVWLRCFNPECPLSCFGFCPWHRDSRRDAPRPLREVQGHVLCAFSPRAWLCYSCASCECLALNCAGCTDHVVFILCTCLALPLRLNMFLCFCFPCRDCGGSGKRKSGEEFFFLTALHCARLPFKCWVWAISPPPVALWMHSHSAWDVPLADFYTLSSVCGLGQDDCNMWDWLRRGFRGGCFGKLMGLAEVGASFFD